MEELDSDLLGLENNFMVQHHPTFSEGAFQRISPPLPYRKDGMRKQKLTMTMDYGDNCTVV